MALPSLQTHNSPTSSFPRCSSSHRGLLSISQPHKHWVHHHRLHFFTLCLNLFLICSNLAFTLIIPLKPLDKDLAGKNLQKIHFLLSYGISTSTFWNLSSFAKPLFSRYQIIPLFPLLNILLVAVISEHTQAYVFNQWFHKSVFLIPTFYLQLPAKVLHLDISQDTKVNISETKLTPSSYSYPSPLPVLYIIIYVVIPLLIISQFSMLSQSLRSVYYHS